MASTYAVQKTALDEIAARIVQNRQRLQRSRTEAASAESDLQGMANVYGSIVSEIDAALVEAPSNVALQVLKAEKDQLVAEFQSLSTAATAMKNATAGVNF